MCHIEEKLGNQNKMPVFYWRFVDKILSKMPDVSSASVFLSTPSEIHPSLSFKMELGNNDQKRRSTGNQLILEFYRVTKAMMKQLYTLMILDSNMPIPCWERLILMIWV